MGRVHAVSKFDVLQMFLWKNLLFMKSNLSPRAMFINDIVFTIMAILTFVIYLVYSSNLEYNDINNRLLGGCYKIMC